MAIAKAGSKHPEFIDHMRAMYLYFGKDLCKTKEFFLNEFGMPKRVWNSIPKTWFSNL